MIILPTTIVVLSPVYLLEKSLDQ